jgi:hypothetical protein
MKRLAPASENITGYSKEKTTRRSSQGNKIKLGFSSKKN